MLHDEGRGIQVIHPRGHLIIILAFSGDGVTEDSTLNVSAAKQADGLYHSGGNPPGLSVLIDFKAGSGEHEGGVLESEVTHDVPVQRLGEGVFHSLLQPHHLSLLGDHVHQHIGGQTFAPVGQPLEQIGIGHRGHADGAALVVDLGGISAVLKLADHVAEGTHLAVPQVLGRGAVQGGNLIKGNLADILGKFTAVDRQQLPVSLGPENGEGDQLSHHTHYHQQEHKNPDGQALLFDEAKIMAHLIFPGGHHRGVLKS